MIFDLSGLQPAEREIIERTLARTSFSWDKLLPGLKASQNKEKILVEFADLSAYGKKLANRVKVSTENRRPCRVCKP